MSLPRPNASARRSRRRAPRPLTAALAELLRAQRPFTATGEEQAVWLCLTPRLASAIARIAARRTGSMRGYRDHPAHAAARRAVRVSPAMAAQWRQDAWLAAAEGLICVEDALLLSAQIDPPDAA